MGEGFVLIVRKLAKIQLKAMDFGRVCASRHLDPGQFAQVRKITPGALDVTKRNFSKTPGPARCCELAEATPRYETPSTQPHCLHVGLSSGGGGPSMVAIRSVLSLGD